MKNLKILLFLVNKLKIKSINSNLIHGSDVGQYRPPGQKSDVPGST